MSTPPFLPPLLRDAPVAVASLSLRGEIVDANAALLQGSEYALEELRGRSFAEFLTADGADHARARFQERAAGKIESYQAERRSRGRCAASASTWKRG